MLEIGRRVVTTAIVNLYSGNIALHDDAAVMPVPRRVRAVIAEQVIGRGVLLHSLEDLGEVVGVEKSATSGIAGEGDERFLRGEVGIEGVERRLSGVG